VHVFLKNDSPHNNILIFIYSSDGDDGLINMIRLTVSFITLTTAHGGPGYCSRHSDLLWTGGSGDRITVWPTQTPIQMLPGVLPGGRAARAWRWRRG
jgi:hypothetical protein